MNHAISCLLIITHLNTTTLIWEISLKFNPWTYFLIVLFCAFTGIPDSHSHWSTKKCSWCHQHLGWRSNNFAIQSLSTRIKELWWNSRRYPSRKYKIGFSSESSHEASKKWAKKTYQQLICFAWQLYLDLRLSHRRKGTKKMLVLALQYTRTYVL